MATLHTHHRTTSTNSKKQAPLHARSSRPAPLTKRTSIHGLSKGPSKPAHRTAEDEDEGGMAASFLQYCTTCEKQIIVPNNSILYCSESCRRQDNEKVLFVMPADNSPPRTPLAQFSFDDLPTRDIVTPLSPTLMPGHRHSAAFSEASEDDPALSEDEVRKRCDSEAARYLRQFQNATSGFEISSAPTLERSDSSQTTTSAAPSLSHTPASMASTSMPYTPSARPLPQRYSAQGSSYGPRSIDLVTPCTGVSSMAPPVPSDFGYLLKSSAGSKTSLGLAEGEMLYEKKSSIPRISPGHGSLKQLFAFNEMQALPRYAQSKWG